MTASTIRTIRAIFACDTAAQRTLYTAADIRRDGAATVLARRVAAGEINIDAAQAIADAYDGDDWPLCWCDCGDRIVTIEGDSGEGAAAGCTHYAMDRHDDVVCECDSRVEDRGQYTGGGMNGGGTGWVRNLIVAEG